MIPHRGTSIVPMQFHSKRNLDEDAGKSLVDMLLRNSKKIQSRTAS